LKEKLFNPAKPVEFFDSV